MTTTPTFVLSLDCEGLWGMLDQPSLIDSGLINSTTLTKAYDAINRVLDSNNIRCTAAFVSTFASPMDLLHDIRDLLELQISRNENWFASINKRIFEDIEFYNSGFNGENFFQAMKVAGHEMAWHGSTHLPWYPETSVESINLEIEIFKRINDFLGVCPTSLIFPRNIMGHVNMLSDTSIDTIRDGEASSTFGRIVSLCKEFTSYNASSSLKPVFQNNLWVHPKGDFLNWASGIRGVVPQQVSFLRWKKMLDNAVRCNGYVHMWFHPHNLITCPRMTDLFEKVMHYVGLLVRDGCIQNLTMQEHTAMHKSDLLI